MVSDVACCLIAAGVVWAIVGVWSCRIQGRVWAGGERRGWCSWPVAVGGSVWSKCGWCGAGPWGSLGELGWNIGVIAVFSTVLLAWGRGRGRGGSGKSWG